MKLFEIDENYNVKPNKAWIGLIPELDKLIKRDKGSKGDSEGRNKLKAKKEFTFIYFYVDFSSPIRDWEEQERMKESLSYAGLSMKDIDEDVWAACTKYKELMFKSSRSLRTLTAVKKGLNAMDNYFESVDFSKVDKTGALLNTPEKFQQNITRINNVYDEIAKLEKRVEEDLSQTDTGIRGQNSLGDNEGKRKDMAHSWSEADILKGSLATQQASGTLPEDTKTKPIKAVSFADLAVLVNNSGLTKEEAENI